MNKERLPNSAGGLQSSTKSLQIESETSTPNLARKNINTFYNVVSFFTKSLEISYKLCL